MRKKQASFTFARVCRALLSTTPLTRFISSLLFFLLLSPITNAADAPIKPAILAGASATGATDTKTIENGITNEVAYIFTDTTTPGTFSLTGAARVRYLIVGGGGSGASPGTSTLGGAGGGGAGGFIESTLILPANEYNIIVGVGGSSPVLENKGNTGADSLILTNGYSFIAAKGGGGGGLLSKGLTGGSGGGGSRIGSRPYTQDGGTAEEHQGKAGGQGAHNYAGGGGGGAGEDGKPTTAIHEAGAGGDGKMSAITGDDVWYAGGGGGGTYANTTTYSDVALGGKGGGGSGGYGDAGGREPATDGEPNTGGGGGGGHYNGKGGAGGSGIVVLRIVEAMPQKPVNAELGYTAAVQTNIFDATCCTITNEFGVAVDAMTGKDVGIYKYTVYLNPNYTWSDGSTNSVPVTLEIKPGSVELPEDATFTFSGFSQTNAFDSTHCTITNITNGAENFVEVMEATKVGVYTYTIYLKPNFAWSDGSTDPKTVVLTMKPILIESPVQGPYTKVYTGKEQTITLSDAQWLEIKNESGAIVNTIAATNVGSYIFTIRPIEGCVWDDGSREPLEVCLKITEEKLNAVTVSLEGWQEDAAPNSVVVTSTPDCLSPSDYTVWYRRVGGKWTQEVPRTAGDYQVTIRLLPSSVFDTTETTITPCSFKITSIDFEKATGASALNVTETKTNSNEVIYIFKGTTTPSSFTLQKAARVRYLVVGGGGSGASPGTSTLGGAGGGGAGGFIESTLILPANEYNIIVGVGGSSPALGNKGNTGADSLILTNGYSFIAAKGGGGGGLLSKGLTGGSGGGGSRIGSRPYTQDGGTAEEHQGKAGGQGAHNYAGGGGGGAGEDGKPTTAIHEAGAGGDGKMSDITGDDVWYAGGGGGGTYANTTTEYPATPGGQGGGGSGGYGDAGGREPATDGEANTGGGGGGGHYSGKGGAGGSGIVVLRIVELMPAAPKATYKFDYDATTHILYRTLGTCKIQELDENGDVVRDNLNEIAVKNAGTYTFKVTLKGDYVWDDGTNNEKTVTVTVNQVPIKVNALSLDGWQAGETPNVMAIASVPRLEKSEYDVLYRTNLSAGVWSAWVTNEAPNVAGIYQASILVTSSNFTNTNLGPENLISTGGATIEPVTFEVKGWSAPDEGPGGAVVPGMDIPGLGYYATFKVKGVSTAPATPTNRFVTFELEDNQPKGFFYRYAAADGSDLRFVSDGKNLPVKIKEWNAKGASTVLVEVPAVTAEQTITMFWGELTTGEVPDRQETSSADLSTIQIFKFDPDWTYTRPNAFFKNRWVVEPSIAPTEWWEGDEPSTLFAGTAAYSHVRDGSAHYKFVCGDGTSFDNVPPSKLSSGTYVFKGFVDEHRAAADQPGTISWQALEHPGYAVIVKGNTPTNDVSFGTSTDALTLSGRVLLANNYTNGTMKIGGQAYDQTDRDTSETYWNHISAETTTWPYLSAETSHTLWTIRPLPELCGNDKMWTLNDIRIGNLYKSVAAATDTKLNYLPATEGTGPAGIDAAHLVFRNVAGAAVTSPCYTNGIGTIYFDAVNATNYNIEADTTTTGWNLCVEVTTNEWVTYETVKLTVLKTTDGTTFEKSTRQSELTLNINKGGSTRAFYRVCAEVKQAGPVRFRICRKSATTTGRIDHDFILVDNIVVSKMPMRAELSPIGFYDAAKEGKQVLGWEGSFASPYPSIKDDTWIAQAKMTAFGTNETSDISSFVTGAKIYYRWRYLEQSSDSWRSEILNPASGKKYASLFSLKLPRQTGDIEFYYEVYQNAPYYKYYDYSGANPSLGTGDYTEYTPAVETRWSDDVKNENVTLPSQGTDWFVRLRDGGSNYESIRAYVKNDETGQIVTNDFFLTDDHLWRSYYKTLANELAGKTVSYRLELLTATFPESGKPHFTTHHWVAGEDLLRPTDIPASPILRDGGTNTWAKVYVDATTGYLLMQLDDRSRSLTLSHADYQDFNGWSDAVSTNSPATYTGSTIDGTRKSGASSKMVRLEEKFDTWTVTPDANDRWKESFANSYIDIDSNKGAYPGYEPFITALSPNAWTANNAMWVPKFYRPTDKDSQTASGLAVQLLGSLGGNLQFLNSVKKPRGLGTVTYRARIGQTINFEDFNYTEAEKPSAMTDYTFITRAAFDLNKNKNFAGNASLSLVAFYRAKEGCYEVRWEQLKGAYNNNKTAYTGPDPTSQRLCLYRWARGESGEIEAELLGAVTNAANFKITQPEASADFSGNFLPFYIAARQGADGETTEVTAGVCGGLPLDASNSEYGDAEWLTVFYRDTSEKRLKSGAYGLLSANCEAYFCQPTKIEKMVLPAGDIASLAVNMFSNAPNQTVSFPDESNLDEADEYVSCKGDLLFDWAIDGERMMEFPHEDFPVEDEDAWGVYAKTPSANLELWTGTGGNWKLFDRKVVKGFGTNTEAGEEGSVDINTVTDDAVQLRVANSYLSDIVLTDVHFTQWRGDNYGEGDTTDFATGEAYYGYPGNIVFTSGIIVPNENTGYKQKVRLSANRTLTGKPASIRSPFFDGGYNSDYTVRGQGLGMFSFDYEDATPNVNVLVQIATNLTKGADVTAITQSVDTNMDWTTVAEFDYEELEKNGTKSVYLGLHGVVGMMRVVLDPALVEKVQSNTIKGDVSIDITRVVMRDEPALESSDWWGWNIRTTPHEKNKDDDYLRTYLPDASEPGQGLSLALNNSVTDKVPEDDLEYVKQRQPFVQTPSFAKNLVGEVSFRARCYDGTKNEKAEVYLYGAKTQDPTEADWEPLHQFVITNTIYETFSFRAAGSYSAFRFSVRKVEDVENPMRDGKEELISDGPLRVLIDEVAVFEAVNPEIAFRYVYPFRDGMEETTACTNVVYIENGVVTPLTEAQPLLGESWTVQAEIMESKLPDEIDMTKHPPRVIFHWYTGNHNKVWGYNAWRNLSKAEGHYQAELALADGETKIFRGSLPLAPDAVVGATSGSNYKVIQYAADVIYRTLSGTELTNSLVRNASTTWVRPYWYAPVDYNAGKASVSAYTILDSISPRRVWINEANIWDGQGGETNQYVEVAAPELQSINGWRLDYIDNNYNTNTLCRFVNNPTAAGYVTAKKDLSKIPTAQLSNYRTNDYVFLAVQSPKSQENKTWANVPGAIDGTWSDFDTIGGKLDQQKTIALRLIRPSNVVEQEIVLIGTNRYLTGLLANRNSPTNWLNKLAQTMPENQLVYVGHEYGNTPRQSLGVVRQTGATADEWSNKMVQTPGRVNEGQIVPKGYVIYSSGEFMVIRAQIGPNGHIRQSFEGGDLSASELTMLVRKGGAGTNIVYEVANWWEIDTITTNGTVAAGVAGKRGTFTFKNVGAGSSNDVTVIVNTQPYKELRDQYGLTADNRYTPAVMAWLEGGKNFFGEPFKNPGEIHLAAFHTAQKYDFIEQTFVTNLNLTTMYWLDMDPTDPGLVLRAGWTDFDLLKRTAVDGKDLTHFRFDWMAQITNKVSGGAAYAPYILRGVTPGETSANYDGSIGGWTSVTFKVTADLQNGVATRERWVPVRWFVFKPKAGATTKEGASASFDENFLSKIDIWDPKDESRAIWTRGWSAYPNAYIWFRAAIDDRGAPITIETLKPDSTYIP